MKTLFFLKAKCVNTNKDYYIRHDFAADDRWVLTYGVKELPPSTQVGGAAMEIDYSAVRIGPQFKCPHCGNRLFIRCGRCGGYTCYQGLEGQMSKCMHCGREAVASGSIDSVTADKTGIGQ